VFRWNLPIERGLVLAKRFWFDERLMSARKATSDLTD